MKEKVRKILRDGVSSRHEQINNSELGPLTFSTAKTMIPEFKNATQEAVEGHSLSFEGEQYPIKIVNSSVTTNVIKPHDEGQIVSSPSHFVSNNRVPSRLMVGHAAISFGWTSPVFDIIEVDINPGADTSIGATSLLSPDQQNVEGWRPSGKMGGLFVSNLIDSDSIRQTFSKAIERSLSTFKSNFPSHFEGLIN